MNVLWIHLVYQILFFFSVGHDNFTYFFCTFYLEILQVIESRCGWLICTRVQQLSDWFKWTALHGECIRFNFNWPNSLETLLENILHFVSKSTTLSELAQMISSCSGLCRKGEDYRLSIVNCTYFHVHILNCSCTFSQGLSFVWLSYMSLDCNNTFFRGNGLFTCPREVRGQVQLQNSSPGAGRDSAPHSKTLQQSCWLPALRSLHLIIKLKEELSSTNHQQFLFCSVK